MGDLIDIKSKVKIDKDVLDLVTFGQAIDDMVTAMLENGFDLFTISAIMSNRLGECIRILPHSKEQGADLIISILLKKAGLSNV